METKKINTFGIWGEMGERSSVKVNIMSVKINDFALPPIQRVTVVALLFFTSCVCGTSSAYSHTASAVGQQ